MEEDVKGSKWTMGTIPSGFTYRDQSKRFPWWVKSVDQITTETDEAAAKRPEDVLFSLFRKGVVKGISDGNARNRHMLTEKIKGNVPGSRIEDVSLLFASGTYFAGGATLDGLGFDGIERIAEIVSVQIHPPQELGVKRWEGTPEAASRMVETACLHLGAAQVGFTAMNPLWIPPFIRIDPNLEDVEKTGHLVTAIPERYRYVITAISTVPPVAASHAPSHIGGAADRVGFEGKTIITERIKNFIKGVGYGAIDLPGFQNQIPYSVKGMPGRCNQL